MRIWKREENKNLEMDSTKAERQRNQDSMSTIVSVTFF